MELLLFLSKQPCISLLLNKNALKNNKQVLRLDAYNVALFMESSFINTS